MVARPLYLDAIERYLGKPYILVLTGIRRSGKSTVLRLLEDRLVATGVPPAQILSINMEDLAWDSFRDYSSLHALVQEKLPEGGYFLLDEAQEVVGWERLVTSLLAGGRIQCVLTGSNASLLTSELGTLLTGRYVEIRVFPLGFAEYLHFQDAMERSPETALVNYLRTGGFPALSGFEGDEQATRSYLQTLVDSILYRDVIGRHPIRDPEGLKRILTFSIANIGNLTSARKISEYFKSQRRTLSTDTVANYLHFLTDAFILSRARRYDLKGKLHLEYTEKYYVTDLGLRYGLIGYQPQDIAGVLENVVYLELLRRGYQISVGVLGSLEVDFVAERGGDFRYFQVCTTLDREDTVEREFRPLQQISDQWPKTIIVFQPTLVTGRNGILVLSLLEFLRGAG